MRIPTVLIVDDDEHSRNTLSDLITRAGYETLVAGHGTEGLANLPQKGPQIILIDIKKPEHVQDVDLILRRRRYLLSPEVIILTGKETLDMAAEAADSWAFGYLLKPYDPGQLLIQIRQAVEKQELDEKVQMLEEQLESRVHNRTKELLQARQTAEADSCTKTEFIARIHSQFRSSLTIIIGCSVILLEELSGGLNEKQREQIKHILDNGRMLQNVMSNGSETKNNGTSNKNGIFQKYIVRCAE